MKVRDIMRTEVHAVTPEMLVSDLIDILQVSHIHGCPVVDENQQLVGFVSQEDILLGSLGRLPLEDGQETNRRVEHIMTSPAIQAHADSDLRSVAEMMWRFRIRHLPLVDNDKLVGIVSALDFSRLFFEGVLELAPPQPKSKVSTHPAWSDKSPDAEDS